MEFDSTTPIYVQIAEDIRHSILIGALEDGDKVMSTTEYATASRINPATAAKAFAALVDEGLLVKRRGIGMFVAEGARGRLRAAGRTGFIADSFLPVVEEGLALGIPADDFIDAIRVRAAGVRDFDKEH